MALDAGPAISLPPRRAVIAARSSPPAMPRPSSRAILLLLALAGAPAARAQPAPAPALAEADAALDDYLESRNLRSLLAERLALRLPTLVGAERIDLAQRLGELYVELLESSLAPAERAAVERSARDLLEAVKDAEPLDLRIRLLRAGYAHAEQLAERWRVRLAPDTARDEAAATMTTLAGQFRAAGLRANRAVDELQRQEEIIRDTDADLLASRLAQARRQRSLAMHLAGWASVYAAELRSEPALALEALESFGWLLNAPVGKAPTRERVPESFMQYEHVARSAVGAAVAHSVRNEHDEAIAWLNFIESAPDTPASVLAELPSRRMIILARAGLWRDLADYIDDRRAHRAALTSPASLAPLSTPEARLLAVLALDAKPADADARRDAQHLATSAISDLIAHAEVGQALDLATHYGEAAFGGSPWLAAHVKGLRLFEQARDAHRAAREDTDAPTARADVARLYTQAAEAIERSLSAPDADRFQAARGRTLLMLGVSLFSAASPAEPRNTAASLASRAADALAGAAALLTDRAQAGEAMAGAVRALELAIDRLTQGAERDPGAPAQIQALRTLRDRTLASFVAQFPESPRAGLMRVKLAIGGGLEREPAIGELLKVSSDSPAFEAAQRHAARLAHEAFRAAGAERDWTALRFADLEEPLMLRDRRRAEQGDTLAAPRALAAARRLLDALLGVAAPDADRAQRAFDAIDALAALKLADLAPLEEELTYRRAQLALARADTSRAAQLVDSLEKSAALRRAAGDPAAGLFARSAARLLYRDAELKWRAARRAGRPGDEVARLARETLRSGGRALLGGASAATAEPPPPDAELLDVLVGAGEAAFDVWRYDNDAAALALAARLHQRALALEPRDAGLLRRSAEIAEASRDFPRAIEAWRTLSSGFDPGSPDWFEARHRLISLLARTDPDRAREAIAQHRVLYPTFGPEPWGERLRALHDQLIAPQRGSAP